MAAVAIGCAKPMPVQAPFQARVVSPGENEAVVVTDVLVVFDSSGSMEEFFPSQKALFESFSAGMPDGNYSAGSIAFGGFKRENAPLARFDRSRARSNAAQVQYLNEATPLFQVLSEARDALAGRKGRAAVVLFSDGVPTDFAGKENDPEISVAAAREMIGAYGGTVCIHTVQIGSSPAGAQFLRRLSGLTDCGSNRLAMAVNDPGALHNFQRQVFLGQTLPRVAAAPQDSDGDGVLDANDRCPNTPRGARVDNRGCWTVSGLLFAFDRSEIKERYDAELEGVAAVLRENPGLRVRLDGYTCDIGPEAHNLWLSQQRAGAVRDSLVTRGVSADRFELKGWGPASPAAPNDSSANRALNRRTEITPIK